MYTTTYIVSVRADPQTISRVVNPFAQQAVVPDHVEVSTSGEHMTIRMTASGLDANTSRLIAQKLTSMFLVEAVSWRRCCSVDNVSMIA